tara:strand:- start:228 stop:686 length:459 start_codon:yes stop_codon:yes gene_type:complete
MAREFQRSDEDKCEFCKASEFVDCAPDCPTNFEDFGKGLPEPLRGIITIELLKQAEWIYEKKQADWMDRMLLERVESVMRDWPNFIEFVRLLNHLHFFQTPSDVIEYITHPASKQWAYMIWLEMGSPKVEGTKAYASFLQALKNYKPSEEEE